MRIIGVILSVLMISQFGAEKLYNPQAIPPNAEYAGYFDFDFDKTPESFYFSDGTFFVMNNNGEQIGSLKPKYPKIYDLSATKYIDSGDTILSFGDYRAVYEYHLTITNGKLEVTKETDCDYEDTSHRSVSAAQALPKGFEKIAFYFGEAVMSTPEEFKNGAAKARYDYFQNETYRDTENDNCRVLFADIIKDKPVMVEAYGSKVYFGGVDITPEGYNDNRVFAFYRVDNQISTSGVSGQSGVFIFRMSENGITESEISHLGNELRRPDADRNEYILTNGMELDGGFNFPEGGRVFKDYVYYKTEDGSYREYGGIDVPIGDFLEIDGAIEFIKPYLEDGENSNFHRIINNIQWRENNTFTVNFIQLPIGENEYAFQGYRVFRYENGKFSFFYASGGYSEYSWSARLGRECATYPEKLPFALED
jgi:hypothetical protein